MIELNKQELEHILKSLKDDLREKEDNATSVEMCLNQKFETERKELIKKIEDYLK